MIRCGYKGLILKLRRMLSQTVCEYSQIFDLRISAYGIWADKSFWIRQEDDYSEIKEINAAIRHRSFIAVDRVISRRNHAQPLILYSKLIGYYIRLKVFTEHLEELNSFVFDAPMTHSINILLKKKEVDFFVNRYIMLHMSANNCKPI